MTSLVGWGLRARSLNFKERALNLFSIVDRIMDVVFEMLIVKSPKF